MVGSNVYINYYEPKADPEASVISFVVYGEDPAKDLEKFIDFGPVKVLDTDVSPAPDEDGNFHVFVEVSDISSKDLAKKVYDLLNVVKFITSKTEWIYHYRGEKGNLKLNDLGVKQKGLI